MPTTTYTTPTVSVSAIGSRTTDAGVAVTDYTAEEVRFLSAAYGEGYLTPTNAFQVRQQTVADMTVRVGSGTSKGDFYVVAGEASGQGNYIIRLDVSTQNVTISAADASQARTDEIYLVVRDNAYDASARGLPQLGYRRGDVGSGNPGPDSTWKASALLARINVPAAATSITQANITDARAKGGPGAVAGSATPVDLVDAATVNTDAFLGSYFRVSLGGNRTLAGPTNASDGQVLTWEFLANGGARTVTLASGSPGTFQFGSDISALSQTVSGKRDLLRAIYNAPLQRWLVVAYVKGF